MSIFMSIHRWPQHERPRERLIQEGAYALSHAEILAILFNHGTKGQSALELARSLLTHYKNLRGVLQIDFPTFCQYPGLGAAKYCQLQAALELGRRQLQESLQQEFSIHSSIQVQQFMINSLSYSQQEIFAVLFLNTHFQMIAFEKLFHGTVNSATVYPREVIKRALYHNATAVIIAHNHPSGGIEPSNEDLEITQRLKQALQFIDIKLLDHFLIASNTAWSFAEHGLV